MCVCTCACGCACKRLTVDCKKQESVGLGCGTRAQNQSLVASSARCPARLPSTTSSRAQTCLLVLQGIKGEFRREHKNTKKKEHTHTHTHMHTLPCLHTDLASVFHGQKLKDPAHNISAKIAQRHRFHRFGGKVLGKVFRRFSELVVLLPFPNLEGFVRLSSSSSLLFFLLLLLLSSLFSLLSFFLVLRTTTTTAENMGCVKALMLLDARDNVKHEPLCWVPQVIPNETLIDNPFYPTPVLEKARQREAEEAEQQASQFQLSGQLNAQRHAHAQTHTHTRMRFVCLFLTVAVNACNLIFSILSPFFLFLLWPLFLPVRHFDPYMLPPQGFRHLMVREDPHRLKAEMMGPAKGATAHSNYGPHIEERRQAEQAERLKKRNDTAKPEKEAQLGDMFAFGLGSVTPHTLLGTTPLKHFAIPLPQLTTIVLHSRRSSAAQDGCCRAHVHAERGGHSTACCQIPQ